jgi:hypothetical protein
MRKANVIFWSAFISCFSNLSCAQGILNLENGFLPPKPASASNPEYVKSRHLEIAVATSSSPDKDGLVVAFVKPGEQSNYYLLTETPFIHEVKFPDDQYLGSWPLTRWPYTYVPDALVENQRLVSTSESKESIRERLATPPVNYNGAGELISNVGCLPEKPLRYGHVFNASETDLLIIMGGQLIVFSPTYKRTVFAEYYHHDDIADLSSYSPNTLAWASPETQYGTLYSLRHGEVAVHAVRSYAKLYKGDIDKDAHPDVVVWRKVYRSNLKTEPQGYTLISNTLAHYEQDLAAQATSEVGVTGEYLPQGTEEDTIKQWLTTNNLTWQKGYPNLSECAGQTDKHIPEMVDPLLNDPDVLK